MNQHHAHPQVVWVLPPDLDEEPQRFEAEGLKEIFDHYEDTGFEPRFDWLYKAIGCSTVERRVLPKMGHLWLDEEGLFKANPQVNPIATLLYQTVYNPEEVVVGTVVLIVEPGVDSEEADRFVRETREHLLFATRELKEVS